MTQPTELMEVSEAARRLGCSEVWVRRLVDTRRLAAVRTFSGQRLIDAADLERLRRERQHRGLGRQSPRDREEGRRRR